MIRIARGLRTLTLTLALVAGATLGSSGIAQAGTAQGFSCGEKHPMEPKYYDVIGNAAPCVAHFWADKTVVARVTIDVIPMRGADDRDDPRIWNVDMFVCEGTVRPSEGPRVFTCVVERGWHTAFVANTVGDKFVDLRVET